jgi:hypothetical protein
VRFRLSVLAALLPAVITAGLLLPVGGATSGGCGANPYTYAGIQAPQRAFGAAAIVTALRQPGVAEGHVAAWVGVGGVGLGPGGTDEWLQVGMSAFPNAESAIYYEVARGGASPRYHQVADGIQIQQPHRFAVLEMAHRPSWWRVWVDGRPASPPVHLPRSHGAWSPQAVAESWSAGSGACNGYEYRFERLLTALHPGGSWHLLNAGALVDRPRYELVHFSREGFVALAPSDGDQRIVTGVPTGISRTSRTIALFRMRTQP